MPRGKKYERPTNPLAQVAGYRISYEPRGAALDLFHCQKEEVLMAGPAGTGKSLAALHKIHLMASKYEGARLFMARKTRTSMTNSCLATFQNHVLRPPDKVHFHKQDQVFNYPNGSMIAVVGLDDPERIKSTDWDGGFIQEATECTENDAEICTTRLRNWKIPYQQLIYDCNPDKPTHWLKRRCDKGLTHMLMSVHEDNPRLFDPKSERWTKEGLVYRGKLQRLSGVRRARLYSGEWVAAEGMIFEMWDNSIHMIDLKDLPQGWETWCHYWAIDWGFIHPFCWQDWIEDPDTGDLYLYRQIYKTKTIVEDHAKAILDIMKPNEYPAAIICDHDAEDRATFERHTEMLTLPAYKAINIGIQAVQRRMRMDKRGRPSIFIVRDSLVEMDHELKEEGKPTCTEEEIDGYIWDKTKNIESNSKKDELPVDKDNHGCDPMRYMVAFADNLAIDPEEFEETVFFEDESTVISPY